MSFREPLRGVPGEGEVASCECLVSEVFEHEETTRVFLKHTEFRRTVQLYVTSKTFEQSYYLVFPFL